MLQISGATERLEIVTTDVTATLDVQVDYAIWDTATGAPTIDSPKNQGTTITGVTGSPNTVLTAAGASKSARVKRVSITNTHATLPQTLNLQRILSGPTTFKFKKVTLQPNEELLINEAGVLFVYDSSGAVKGTIQGPVDVQVFTASGAGTWTKPTSFTPKITRVMMWGAGGGGGAGSSVSTHAAVKMPGAGGGGGAFTTELFAAGDLAATVAVNVGAVGAAGAPGAAGALGGDGGVGGNSTFGTVLSAFGGGGGRGGAVTGIAGSGGGGGGTASVGVTASANRNPGPAGSNSPAAWPLCWM